MRIRKHAKISPLVYATSSLKPGTVLQTHVCQLNQSPWDVMSFSPPSTPPPPPPPSQVNGHDASAGNGSSGHCISALEREFNVGHQREYSDDFAGDITANTAAEEEPPKAEQIIMCCKTDGKSWQCRREAAKGNSLCEHHLSLVKSYNSLAHHANKKSDKPSAEARRRPVRLKKASTSSSSNPYEFYYYSGFGPRWGKKRGESGKNNGSTMPKSVGQEHEMEIDEARLSKISDDEEFDYAETEDEEEEEEEEENRDNGKKRVRKPIKARSLKSLM